MKNTIIILISLLLFSCGSKKKTVSREKIKEVSEVVEQVKSVVSESVGIETFDTSSNVELEVSENEILEVEADSSGVVSVEVVKTDNGYMKTFTGVKSVRVVNERKEVEKSDTLAIVSKINAEKSTVKEESSSIKIKSEKNGRNTEVEIQSKSTGFWIMLFLIILLLLVWLILRKKVSWLP